MNEYEDSRIVHDHIHYMIHYDFIKIHPQWIWNISIWFHHFHYDFHFIPSCPLWFPQYLIWVNYNNSLTWIKAIWGWFPLLTMIPVRSQWGRDEIYPDEWSSPVKGHTPGPFFSRPRPREAKTWSAQEPRFLHLEHRQRWFSPWKHKDFIGISWETIANLC